MTDPKKPDGDNFDWDQALSEWDKGPPEESDGSPAAAAPPKPPAAPLYRPPVPTATDDRVEVGDFDDQTRMAPPLEAPKERRGRRGGLGQLFKARDSAPDAPAKDDIDVLLDDLLPGDDDVVTSAADVETRAVVSEPLRRPSASVRPPVPEGAMFDPFADDEFEAKPTYAPSTVPNFEAPTPQLLAPSERLHDPDETTGAFQIAPVMAELESARETKGKADSEEVAAVDPSELISSNEYETVQSLPTEKSSSAPPPSMAAESSWEDERPAVAWLEEAAVQQMLARATWLAEEARSVPDKLGQARGLLVASELYALGGDRERSGELAAEARALAPQLPMIERQLRAAIPFAERGRILESLESELRNVPTPAAKLHATLFASTLLSAQGDSEAASKRLDQAARMAPTDVRVMLLRAAAALARSETASPTLRFPDAPETAVMANAVGNALRLRGVERKDVTEPHPADSLRRARSAIAKNDAVGAAEHIAELRSIPELSKGSLWLASAFAATRTTSREKSAAWLRELVELGGDLARRALAARGLEMNASQIVSDALAEGDAFSPPERVIIAAIANIASPRLRSDLEALSTMPEFAPLVSAASSVLLDADRKQEDVAARSQAVTAHAERGVGSPATRAATRLGRLLAAGASDRELEPAVAAIRESAPEQANALGLEVDIREGRQEKIVQAILSFNQDETLKLSRTLAAALVAERTGLTERAAHLYKEALAMEPKHEAAMRSLVALDPETDLVTALQAAAEDESDGVRAALAALEGLVRSNLLDSQDSVGVLERIHRLAPTLGIGAFFAERLARRTGNVEEVLKWVRERRQVAVDPLEIAIESVREALLVADADAGLAAERLEEAHRARPDDIALRDLYERLAPEPPADRAAWREARGNATQGQTRTLFFIEAAYEYERIGEREGALRVARAATFGEVMPPLARVALERAELGANESSRLADELLGQARNAPDVRARLEAFERLADLDQNSRNDPASALLWHRSILEETPRHLSSLRYVEQVLLAERRDDELEPVSTAIAQALKGTGGGESSGHAVLSGRLRMRSGDWDGTKGVAVLAAAEKNPTLWALRLANAHARAADDNEGMFATSMALLERASRPQELASLAVRAAESAQKIGNPTQALTLLERAATEDPGDVVTWAMLASAREQAGNLEGAAEAHESHARTSAVQEHQLGAWFEAATLWQRAESTDVSTRDERATAAFEAAAAINVTYRDVFPKLSALYGKRGARTELAALLERRISTVLDPDERVTLEVDRGRALAEVGDAAGAKSAYEAALAVQPDHVPALTAFADLAASEGDWNSAEQSWVRLGRLITEPAEQQKIFARLGELYLTRLPNLSRAEVAFQEVLKRAPDDLAAREQLVRVYKKQNDAPKALELQQELIAKASDHPTKRARVLELADIYENVSHETRKAEQTFEAARREFPTDVHVLRGLAEFHIRHKQEPAVKVLLDRAAGDATRAFTAGRFTTALFETMITVYELRNNQPAARVVASTLAAFTGKPAELAGGEARALDPRFDDLLAPEALTPSMRALLQRTGEALDLAAPFDPRAMRTSPIDPSDNLARRLGQLGQSINMPNLQVLVSPSLGRVVVPVSSNPPTIVMGEAMLAVTNEAARAWSILRALKLLQARGAVFARLSPTEGASLVGGWLKCFNPQWTPPGVAPAAVTDALRRVQANLPKELGTDVGMMALEAATTLGAQLTAMGGGVLAWANHAALLGVGDPSAALDAIAWMGRGMDAAPAAEQERATWIGRNPEAKDIIGYTLTAPYSDARKGLSLP